MKKFLLLVLSLTLFCGCFAITAFMANEGGMTFEDYTVYFVENDLEKEPVTIEATLYFNKRLNITGDCGSIFGNTRSTDNVSGISISINKAGNPILSVKGEASTSKTGNDYKDICTFSNASVIKGAWVHLTIVRDIAKNEARCYIDGELAGTAKIKDLGPISLCDYVVGGNMTYLNRNHFKFGKLGSLAVYSDVRTEAEIKKDMENVGTDNLLLHYDFMNITEKTPATLTDLSKNKNDAVFSRVFFDEKEPVTDYAYTFAVIGDTQRVAVNSPLYFNKIYEHVYDNINCKNIEMVIGLGDITDTPNGQNTANEWEVALEGMKVIDDYVPHIPVRGDHDSVFWYNKTMPEINYADIIDGYMVDGDYKNTYVDIEIGGIPYLFLQLDWAHPVEQIEWAKGVVEKFPNHNVIVSTHVYMSSDDTHLSRGDQLDHSTTTAGYISSEEIWNDFISQYENIVLVLCGHTASDIVSVTQRKGVNGNTVTEILIDFQSVDDTVTSAGISPNGAGIVNYLHFSEDGKKVTVETYSTIMEKYFYDANQFTVELDTVTDKKYVKPEKAPVPDRNAAKPVEIKMTIDALTATVNDEAKTLDAAPIIRNSRTMLPVRFVAENLGATVGWDDATKTVSVKSADVSIEIVIGATTAKVNGKEIALDSPAFIESSRTYLPVRVVAENLGATVSWDDATKTATLTK